mmetsp:Transcript_1824/g.6499  ORF Transcript_1824/g.6499 Transcript_1824/m.6499 type:complete len:135 (-) Transcript_1824:7-411(-)
MLHGAALALLRRSASRDEVPAPAARAPEELLATSRPSPQAWAACFVLGLGCGAAAVHLALGMHASQLYHSRGHARPTPLAKDRDGHWVPSGEVQAFWCLLGSFSTTAEECAPAAPAISLSQNADRRRLQGAPGS